MKDFVPDLSDCTANTTAVYSSIRDAINDFTKDNKTIADIADGIEKIGVAIQGLASITTSCKKLPASLQSLIDYFLKIVANPSRWFQLVSENATKNSIWIMWNLSSLSGYVTSGDYKTLGVKLGEIFKWILKVDLSKAVFLQMDMKVELANTTSPISCASALYEDGPKIFTLVTRVLKGEYDLSLIFEISALVQDIVSKCKSSLFPNFVAVHGMTKVSKVPSIDSIIQCVKSVKPFATDVYNAITYYTKGDTDAAMKALTQAGIDAIGMGSTCYKVIEDILN